MTPTHPSQNVVDCQIARSWSEIEPTIKRGLPLIVRWLLPSVMRLIKAAYAHGWCGGSIAGQVDVLKRLRQQREDDRCRCGRDG